MSSTSGELPEGVTVLDHTADVAIEIVAPDLPNLFDAAAAGMFALVFGAGEPSEVEEADGGGELESNASGGSIASASETVREIDLTAGDLPSALVRWLRELLYLYQSEGIVYRRAEFETVSEAGTLRARVYGAPSTIPSVREIKGVPYHNLEATRRGGGWYARVVFDV